MFNELCPMAANWDVGLMLPLFLLPQKQLHRMYGRISVFEIGQARLWSSDVHHVPEEQIQSIDG